MERTSLEGLWGHVYWLNVLAQQGSFTAAARRLGVSKAGVSQRIAELERQAGMQLVQRTTRSVRLTEAGQRLVNETRSSFDAIAHSFEGIRDMSEAPSGLLRVSAPVALARQHLVPRLHEFLRAYPGVRLELELSDRLVSIATEGFHLAIRHTATPPDTHVAWALCETRSVLVASRAYLRRAGSPAHPQDLLAHECLHYPREGDTPAWHFVERAASRRGAGTQAPRVTIPVKGVLAANNSEALRDAALSGLGVALLPDFSAQAVVRAGRLVEVLPRWEPVGAFAERLYAIRPYAPYVPKRVTAFVNWLREAFTGGFSLKAGAGD
ncbi:LysR family transcriptional regulator [Variovorax sp. J31P207]|uniref:LysR family transcriptional regulator n=1 Tax=Variovorax sp. J31P207 TaxID=3053510 RepID=UPI00257718AB|nr:LysR family transcriptional regulator [Variovorax sp. J31P207]MDM0066911.1 LysR family transcriptional regulator [Variovorax sp. J31P207]